jgi:UDP-2,4-diacetamido-2,4,6-trideoxy-beta-L-altropyranose hydrolase
MNKRILFRVDASPQMGAGHLMRMVALGQFLSDAGYEIHFATIPHNIQLVEYLRSEGFQVYCLKKEASWDALKDGEQLAGIAGQIQPAWVVLDGYHFDADYELKIKQSKFSLLRMVDIPSGHYYADVILNQNYGAEDMAYSAEKNTRILAGVKYVMLRREFRRMDLPSFRKENEPFHILVSLGNVPSKTDALNLKIAQGFSGINEKGLSATMIIGRMNGESSRVAEEIKRVAWPIEVKSHSQNMAEEMSKADLAIVSGGSTMWELMHMRVPFLAVSLTQEQRSYLPLLAGNGLCVDLGWHEHLSVDCIRESVLAFLQDREGRIQMSDKFQEIVDRRNIGRDLLGVLEG